MLRSIVLGISLFACHPGGSYATDDHLAGGQRDRGETNGRTFDFVSNKPEGDDWTIRVRGSSLWASYAEGEATQSFPPANMSSKDTTKLWELIDALDLANRKKGKKEYDDGFVTLVLREPPGEDGDEQHSMISVNVSRTTKDEAVIDLADYLSGLIKKYFKTKGKPEF